MVGKPSIYRVQNTDSAVAERTREIVRDSRNILDKPAPGTFAGRKTEEPFPQEDDEEMIRWISSKELQPPT